MSSPRAILAAFAACLVVVLAAMAWVSVVVVGLDRRDAATQRQAELQENVRLALWRMDSALNPIVAQEQARPFHDYQALSVPPVALDAAYRPISRPRVLLPSPLLTHPPAFVKLHFQIDPAGRVASPQTPDGLPPGVTGAGWLEPSRVTLAAERLRELTDSLDRASLLAAAPEPNVPVNPWPRLADAPKSAASEPLASEPQQPDSQRLLNDLNTSNAMAQSTMPQDLRQQGRARNFPAQQALRSDMEYQQRVEANVQSKLLGKFNRYMDDRGPQQPAIGEGPQTGGVPIATVPPTSGILPIEGDMHPLWIGERLLLVRRVRLGDQTWLQGCWLDWDSLRAWLVQRVTDLLPQASLVPATGPTAEQDRSSAYLLAALPIRLVPGRIDGADEALSPPIRSSLMVAWLCTLLAVCAVLALALGTMSLSERRAAFVSAVTHELRTPLTTFRMYTEMLAGGMVPDEARRREYLETLHGEADRLAQLIENVLSYARLERRRVAAHVEEITVAKLTERFAARMRRRAEQAQMEVDMLLDSSLLEATVRTDVSVVEQIVANLVDNACKYAAAAEDRRIHLHLQADRRWLRLRVTDHGPGVALNAAGRLFRPFCRSAQEAANSAPGVGLGLALSRRLARRLGGDLVMVPCGTPGACFELKLPMR